MNTKPKTDAAANSKATSSGSLNRQHNGLASLLQKLDNNPTAAEAMRQALAQTRAELEKPEN